MRQQQVSTCSRGPRKMSLLIFRPRPSARSFAFLDAIRRSGRAIDDRHGEGGMGSETARLRVSQEEPHAKAQRRKERQEVKKSKKTQNSFLLFLCVFAPL